ncbi:acetyltransferase (isoleucine patch superfamily) [Desulfitobacterium dehalogenans ATCC 51507]|uniref:Acetyltransferase (Isoleucine patch superfamily) n=1 Tax=Desulfitobacterium dehalogenans (strain ATCC 51507 / DSM 9161 / JW/IU-DC1) TaxID=756499 RepID=I4ACY3_DESDJ|nr:CatB-related O-acetyltransferase [Desulfitobacterium dehalogenans]AFM01818.1 acetyltransferase (isoleucine patch superfamily) [Desulfitobacterium dehalogenans ATCC 51507]
MIVNFQVNPKTINRLTTVKVNLNNVGEFPLLNIGVDSYIVSSEVQSRLDLDSEFAHSIQIGNYCSIATNLTLMVNLNHDYKSVTTSAASFLSQSDLSQSEPKIRKKGQIIIQNDVWIGHDTLIMSGVKIGNGAVIGAGSVVAKDIPPYSIAVGNPCRVINYRFTHEQIEKLQLIRWWDFDIKVLNEHAALFTESIDKFIDVFYPEALRHKQKLFDLKLERKDNSFLLFSDFEEPFSVWKKVLKEYCSKFTNSDSVTLIIYMSNRIDIQKHISEVESITQSFVNCPDVLVYNCEVFDERLLFMQADYFITTRSINTVRWTTYADEFGLKILAGVDPLVF